MDALAQGYGSDSDSDSDSSSSAAAAAAAAENTSTTTNTNALSNLLGSNYSDDSSDDDNDNDNNSKNANQNQKKKTSKLTSKEKMNDNGNGNEDGEKAKKKQKIEHQLPLPRLRNTAVAGVTTKDNPFDALILFEKDYISDLQQKQSQKQSPNQSQTQSQSELALLSSKLDTMYHTFNTNDKNQEEKNKNHLSFAKHLKNQKEFGNPHLFPSIIEHFHIDPLGSNCLDGEYKYGNGNGNGSKVTNTMKNTKNTFARFEYVENIVQKEEENRIRDCSINL